MRQVQVESPSFSLFYLKLISTKLQSFGLFTSYLYIFLFIFVIVNCMLSKFVQEKLKMKRKNVWGFCCSLLLNNHLILSSMIPSLSPGSVYSVHEINIFPSGAGKEAGRNCLQGQLSQTSELPAFFLYVSTLFTCIFLCFFLLHDFVLVLYLSKVSTLS